MTNLNERMFCRTNKEEPQQKRLDVLSYYFPDLLRTLDRSMMSTSTSISNLIYHLSRLVTEPTKWHVRPTKTQISLGIRPVWSESSLCIYWVAKDPSFLHVDSEDSDQTGRMPRLI